MPTKKSESSFSVSVVIPGHNRPDSLRETLKALREQTLSSKKYEVIVIGFTGTSLQTVADENAKLAKHAFTYQEINTRWPDAKRNEGIRLAKGKIVAFTDDDVLPQNDWLEKLLESFEKNPDAIGVEGHTDGDNTPLLSHATKNTKGGEYPTCNLAFKKDVLQKIGGFDEVYHFFREDTDIAYRAAQQGKIVFDSQVKVFHPTRFTTPKSILNELGMTRGEIRLAKKFPKTYNKKYGFPGRGGWLQSLFSWAVVIASIWMALRGMPQFLLLGIVVLIAFRWLISYGKRTGSFTNKLKVWFYMLVRDLAYPFFFAYFWLFVEHPTAAE